MKETAIIYMGEVGIKYLCALSLTVLCSYCVFYQAVIVLGFLFVCLFDF